MGTVGPFHSSDIPSVVQITVLVGAGGGALYGVNENRKTDERYRAAYASCLRSRGYTS